MFKSFRIKNFRCFTDLSVEPLERVNLISGKNNVGKTSFLEAFFLRLGANNSELPMRVNGSRGLEPSAESLHWLFLNTQVGETIELITHTYEKTNQSLRIWIEESEVLPVIPGSSEDRKDRASAHLKTVVSGSSEDRKGRAGESLKTEMALTELILEYQDNTGIKGISRISFAQDEIRFNRAKIGVLPTGIFIRSDIKSAKENVERFSELDAVSRAPEVLETLGSFEERLRRVSILVKGGNSSLMVDIGEERLVPIGLLGDGLGRLVTILLAIISASKGVVLIDEIENGFHYSTLPLIWRAISTTAQKYDTQVFATTHSWECVKSAHQVFSERSEYDFRLHRLERVEGIIGCATYDREALDSSVKMNIEVR